jgi:hypothetical protein
VGCYALFGFAVAFGHLAPEQERTRAKARTDSGRVAPPDSLQVVSLWLSLRGHWPDDQDVAHLGETVALARRRAVELL